MRGVLKIFWSLLFCLLVWAAGFFWFVTQIPGSPSSDPAVADLIVVLTGGAGRLDHGLELLADGKGSELFITGIGHDLPLGVLLNQASPELRARLGELPGQPISLGRDAVNTIGNVEETERFLAGREVRSLRIVTSSYHMPRSLSEFAYVFPGVALIPEPVFTDDFPASGWWKDADNRTLALSEYHKFLAATLRHWLVSATED